MSSNIYVKRFNWDYRWEKTPITVMKLVLELKVLKYWTMTQLSQTKQTD